MARYNRDFLVPYLRDISALYMAKRKISEHCSTLNNQIHQLQRGTPMRKPRMPEEETVLTGGRLIALFLLGFIVFMGIIGLVVTIGEENSDAFSICLIIVCAYGALLMIPINGMIKTKRKNKEKLKAYEDALEAYDLICVSNQMDRKKIPFVQDEIQQYKNQEREIVSLLQNAYSVNIIPNQYRNMYAIVYLYDYFNGSREDDLALALNTFVLEQIKDRLDRLIVNQSEMILNQYRIIGNQQKAMEQRERHHAELLQKLDKIDASNEERNVYLSMIKSNTDISTFFTSWNFYR